MKVVIVGGVAGGASAAARLRRLDEKAEIVMLERGPYISFANCGLPYYIVARKSVKPYMSHPLTDEVVSITTQKAQTLCLDGKDAMLLKGKKVAVVDDVISTGESLQAIERLVEKAGGEVAARAAILAEGDAARRSDIIFLEELPLFPIGD